ncbi:peroxidase 5-like [Chenopodium quinoa]|uniref:peroxidase 5-like n=1 Tax=Chenopodium quinoa TaxID=63459 RepID=UPI000B77B10E|nr:peroxidase 5-like [Chenopodium quinoa]
MRFLHQNIRIQRANILMKMKLALVILVACFLSSDHIVAGLQVGFYRDKCPFAEAIIKDEVKKSFLADKGIAAGIIRLQFHDCFVRGCDGSLLIDSTPENQAEKDSSPNVAIRGLEVIDNAKARLEAVCMGVVSCADIIAYAARDSNVISGGLYWDVPAGRRDGRISRASETEDIPKPTFNLDQLIESFAKKGLTQGDMVALSGSHTIGRSHCFSFTDRLYNYNTKTMQDPNLDPHYAKFLKIECPRFLQGILNQTLVVAMNQSPFFMDSSYYGNLFKHAGLFNSDQSLLDSQTTAEQAAVYATNNLAWKVDFARAMIKLSQVQVLTETQGEIRANCRVINP